MSNSLERLLDGMQDSFILHVLPRLSDKHAVGQLHAVIQLIEVLKLRAQWSVDLEERLVRVQERAFEQLADIKAAFLIEPETPPWPDANKSAVRSPDRHSWRNDGDASAMIDWVEDHRASLPLRAVGAFEAWVLSYSRAVLEVEVTHLPSSSLAKIVGS